MRTSAVTTLSTSGASTPSFTILTGDILFLAWTGTGDLSLMLEYQAESLTGAPWIPVSVPGYPSAFVDDWRGSASIPNLPRGYYRLTTTEYLSGSREVQLIAI